MDCDKGEGVGMRPWLEEGKPRAPCTMGHSVAPRTGRSPGAGSSWGKERGAVALVQLERQDRRLGTKQLQEGRGAPRQDAPLPQHLGKPGAWRGALNTPRLTSWSCSRFSREVPTATKVVMVAGTVPVALPPSSECSGLDWEPRHGQRAGRKERNGFAGCRASHQGGVRIFPASPSANSLCWPVLARGQSVG